ncbi:serine protease [Deinococcus sp. HMF7604]|uniref:S1 family peptidase n=1 Tax=Deinococcus betulae TaxID=2873312 RepID=UPI001CCE61BE|nr:serine protease [Deinococcus betulae]MBZ9753312.1 serine protease [Deinococcus betulae]
MRNIGVLAWLCGLLLWCWGGAQALPKDIRERIIQATVMLLPTDQNGDLDGSRGSGSIISPQGYILTNYHVVGDPETRVLSHWIQVRTIRFVDREPEFTYWGKVVAGDPNLDLAIVQIVEDKDEKPVSRLNLPSVELGDSNSLIIGDDIFVFGFQGTGGYTISFSRGSVGGFTGDDLESSGRQWIKHDAQTGPGNSGGGVYDESGALIGVHSAGLAGGGNSRTAFMRPLAVAWGLVTPNVTGFVVKKSGSAAVTATTNVSSGAAGLWPPTLATGRNSVAGTVRVTGSAGAGTWTLDLTELLKDGGLKGTARSGSQSQTAFFYYDEDDNEVWVEWTRDGKAFTSCIVEPGGVSSSDWKGAVYAFKDLESDGTRAGDCVVSLKAKTAGTSASATSGTASAGGAALAWPPSLKVGQTWTATFTSVGTYNVALSKANPEGGFDGTATRGSESSSAILDYADGELFLIVQRSDKTFLVCSTERAGLSGATVRGAATTHKNADDKGTGAGTCTLGLK